VILHAIVADLETARVAVEGGATVIQLRLKGASTEEVVERGRAIGTLCAANGVTFVVNDDVGAAIALGADGVHLGRGDDGADRAQAEGLLVGLSAATVREAAVNEFRGASYIGAGPVWPTPSKPDADPPLGLDGLRLICAQASVPVVAIGGVDASNAADCIRAGAHGVAVIRAIAEIRALRAAIDEALAAR
jgi:thiamine-phosphate pyrophosphorylase